MEPQGLLPVLQRLRQSDSLSGSSRGSWIRCSVSAASGPGTRSGQWCTARPAGRSPPGTARRSGRPGKRSPGSSSSAIRLSRHRLRRYRWKLPEVFLIDASKVQRLPPLCLYNGQGADLLQDPPFLLQEGSVRQGRPGSSCFYTSLREGALSILLIRPAEGTPPTPSPLGRRGLSISQGRISCARHPARRKSRPAAGRASIAISYFRHRFKVGEQARRSLSGLPPGGRRDVRSPH